MDIFKLEKLLNENEEEFFNYIVNVNKEFGLERSLSLFKKSGICINEFGTGKPQKYKLYTKVLKYLKSVYSNTELLKQFEIEVKLINSLFKDLADLLKNGAEREISNKYQVVSYLITLEIFLESCSDINFLKKLNIKITGLKDPRPYVIENIVDLSGLALNYFIYKKFPFTNISKKISLKEYQLSSQHISLLAMRKALKVIEYSWNYFNMEIKPFDNWAEFITKGHHVLGATISKQIFFDIRNAKMSRFSYQDFLLKKEYLLDKKLPPHHFISLNEEMAIEFINEYFSVKDLNEEFNCVSLAELVRAYSIISIESRKFLNKRKDIGYKKQLGLSDVCIVKSKENWIKKFNEVGISSKKAELIIDLLTFKKDCVDITDCPFIVIDNYYVVIPSAANAIDPARAIMSNLNSKNINISIKGTKFEHEIREVVKSAGLKCITLHEKISPVEEYECDGVFNIDNDVFFIEIKHLNHPVTYREYQRTLDELEGACSQLTRITNHFSQNENILKNKLGINKIGDIYKIVVTNVSQGEILSYNDCYITDDTHFTGYFKRKPPKVNTIEEKVIVSKSLFTDFYTGSINTKQFISLIKTSPLIKLCKKRIGYEVFDYSKELGFKLVDFDTKVDSIVLTSLLSEEEQKEILNIYDL